MGAGNKAPLTDLRAMSIKLDCHVLFVMHSHAATTARRLLVNLSPAGSRFQTSVLVSNSPTFMPACFFGWFFIKNRNLSCSIVYNLVDSTNLAVVNESSRVKEQQTQSFSSV